MAIGIAGLSTALALRRVGHHVLVLERNSKNLAVSCDVATRDDLYLTTARSLFSAAVVVSGCHPT